MKYIIQCKFASETDSKFFVKILNKLKDSNSLTPLDVGNLSEVIKTMDRIEDKYNENLI